MAAVDQSAARGLWVKNTMTVAGYWLLVVLAAFLKPEAPSRFIYSQWMPVSPAPPIELHLYVMPMTSEQQYWPAELPAQLLLLLYHFHRCNSSLTRTP